MFFLKKSRIGYFVNKARRGEAMREKLLELLKKREEFTSGEELGEKLGVSRAAIWKAIERLKEMGYYIEAITNKGYKLIQTHDLVNAAEIKEGLNTIAFGKNVIYYEETDSTNTALRKLVTDSMEEGTVVIAEYQNAGKGRLGRMWTSPKGAGVWMSILLRPDMPPNEASKLTLIAGLSVCKAIRSLTGLNADIKWPNDVLINGKKICGILTEMNAEMDHINFIILGIGVNVNMSEFSEELSEVATSLKIEGGKLYLRKAIVQIILQEFEKSYNNYVLGNDFEEFANEYRKYCVTLNKEVKVLSKKPFSGKAVNINSDGELIVEKENGERTIVFSGEVSIRYK